MQAREMKAEQESDIRIKGRRKEEDNAEHFSSFVSMRNRQSDGGDMRGRKWT